MANNKKVLIIDDEPGLVTALEQMLCVNGYDVGIAYDGALEKMKKDLPHVIIADIMMPKMDGFTFYKELKKNKIHADIPVIIVSARSKMVDTFLALGVDAFLNKPCDAQELLNNVERLILKKGPVLAPKESGAVKRDIPKDIPAAQPRPEVSAGKKKTLIFGDDEKVNEDMRQQLEKLGCFVAVIQEEGKLLAAIKEIGPDVVFLAINARTQEPVDVLVAQLSALTPKPKMAPEAKKKKADSLLVKEMSVVLYKIEEEAQGIKETTSDLADTENLIERCCENGASKYIGAYSAVAFISKVKEFLR